MKEKHIYEAGLDGVTFWSNGKRLLGGFYKAEGDTPRPTAIILHGLPGIEKHLDIAYGLRDLGWNCLYFHFRGSWGSQGDFSLDGMQDDTAAAIDWIYKQECVDKDVIVLIGASTGMYPALLQGAQDTRIRAIIGVSPVVIPKAFDFPLPMAEAFAEMLHGISSSEMINQWNKLNALNNAFQKFSPRPVLLIAAGDDDIFPASDYASLIRSFDNVELIEKENTDHGFSSCRTWLVKTISEFLNQKYNRQITVLV